MMFATTLTFHTFPANRMMRAALLGLMLSAFVSYAHAELPAGDVKAGAQIYNTVCKGCHGVSIAPTLRGIIDRPIASIESFATYTEGLKAKQGQTWSVENLDKFLTNPAEFAPGTDMVQIIPEAQKRADIIAFLQALPPPRN